MVHYFMQDGFNRIRKQMESSTEEEITEIKNGLETALQYIVSGKLTRVNVEYAIFREDHSFDPEPQNVTLRDKNGLSTKILGNTLYLGTNGDWVNFSMIYDVLEIEWKSYFEN